MRVSRQKWLLLALAVALQGCASSADAPSRDAHAYFWLPQLGAPNETLRADVSAALDQRGFTQSANASLALALSTDATVPTDSSLGFGVYTGGYAFYQAAPAPAGYAQVVAYDIQTLQPVWRIRWRAGEAIPQRLAQNSARRPT